MGVNNNAPSVVAPPPSLHLYQQKQPSNIPIAHPVPNYESAHDTLLSDDGQPTRRGKFRDLPCAVLFIICALGIMGLAFGVGVPEIVKNANKIKSDTNDDDFYTVGTTWNAQFGIALAKIFVIVMVMAVVLTQLWVQLLLRCAERMIDVAIFCSFILSIGIAIALFFLIDFVYPSIVMVIYGLLLLIWRFFNRHRIAFAAANLSLAAQIIRKYPSTVGASILTAFTQVIWLAIGVLAVIGVAVHTHDSGTIAGACVGLFFIVTWGSEVWRGCLHCAVAGTVGSWWGETNPKDPALGALKRAYTYSFGSVAFGGAIVAILRMLRNTARRAAKRHGAIACVGLCLASLVERIGRYLTEYAYVFVALYGKTFVEAGKETWYSFKERGFTTILNDFVIDRTLRFAALSVGLVGCGIGIGVGVGFHHQKPEEIDRTLIMVMGGVIGFYAGLVISLLVLTLIESAVKAIYVCWADAPDALRQVHPETFGRFLRAWVVMHPKIMQQSGYTQAYGEFLNDTPASAVSVAAPPPDIGHSENTYHNATPPPYGSNNVYKQQV